MSELIKLMAEDWNRKTEKGICFICGKKFKAKRNTCKCGKVSCKHQTPAPK